MYQIKSLTPNIFGLVLLITISTVICSDDENCILDNSYDQSQKTEALALLDNLKPYFGQDLSMENDNYIFNMRLCGDSPDVNTDEALFFSTITQKTKKTSLIVSLGRRNNTLVVGGDNFIMLSFTGGKDYGKDGSCAGQKRHSHVLFTCSKYKYALEMKMIEEGTKTPKCNYMFIIEHSSVCNLERVGLGGGAIFLIIMLVGFLAYFIGGFLYRRFAMGAKGTEQVPHREFWMKAGNMFANCCDMMCRCDRYCDGEEASAASTTTTTSRGGYSPIGEQPRVGGSTLDNDAALLNP